MKVVLNGTEIQFEQPPTIQSLLERFFVTEISYVAVAVNFSVVRRRDYAVSELNDGDIVEVLSPQQGG